MHNNPAVALQWLEEAVNQVAVDGNKTIKESQVQQVMRQVQKRLTSFANKEETDDKAADRKRRYNLYNVPPMTTDINKMNTPDDR